MHHPIDWIAAKQPLCYLKHTIHQGLFLKHHQHLNLTTFSNVDWAGKLDNRTSATAYIVYLGGSAISWCSRKQKSVARSSTEAEYRALASCAAEVIWLHNLLKKLDISLTKPLAVLLQSKISISNGSNVLRRYDRKSESSTLNQDNQIKQNSLT